MFLPACLLPLILLFLNLLLFNAVCPLLNLSLMASSFCKVRVVLRANQISCCSAFLKHDPKAHALLMLHNPFTHM